MELIQLLSFYQIVKTGSFSKASKSVFRSQSAVSHQIKNLENEFNIKLFERLGRRVKLTEEGKLLFDVINAFVNDLNNLKRIYEDIQHSQVGILSVSISHSIMAYWFPDIIRKFIDQFPNIKLRLTTCSTRQIQQMVLNDEADFGIGPRASQLFSEKIHFLSWKSFDRGLLVARDHPLSKKRKIALEDIAKYPLILYPVGKPTRNNVEKIFNRNKMKYEIIMELDFAEHIKKFVEMGVGVSIIPSFTITHKERGNLAFINLSTLFGKAEYGIYYRENKYFADRMKRFINFFAPELLDHFPSITLRKA